MSEQGTCTVCGEKLQGVGLSPADRRRMRSSIVQIAAQNGAAEVCQSFFPVVVVVVLVLMLRVGGGGAGPFWCLP